MCLALIILVSCIGCDQATKSIATQALKDTPAQVYLGGTIRLQYALNPGGFLSLGSNIPDRVRQQVFVGVNIVLMLIVASFLVARHNMPLLMFVAITCILAGGIGNLIDRVFNQGLVTDFINLGIGPVRTGIFNVADIAVTFGGIATFLIATKNTKLEVDMSSSASPTSEQTIDTDGLPTEDCSAQ